MESIIEGKSKAFALKIIGLYKNLVSEKREYELAKQILRCGTSIGANVAEAEHGISSKDFLAKMYIAFKECAETQYWLELLYLSGFITREQYDPLSRDCDELYRLLSSITKTKKETPTS